MRGRPQCACAHQRVAVAQHRDREALAAFREVTRLEGIIPALEAAHALAWVLANPGGEIDLVCLSGRGDKDLAEVIALSAER